MFEVARDYPTALAAGPAQPELAIKTAIQWVSAKRRALGGHVLLFVPGKQNLEDNPQLLAYSRTPGVAIATWRGRSSASVWDGGPVLAAWPRRDKLAEVADLRGVRAFCVVPWAEGDTEAWASAHQPELLPGAVGNESTVSVDPVVEAALTDLTASVNHSNNLAGALDHRDAVVTLMTLRSGGYDVSPDLAYSWALTHGWPGRGAERLRELVEKAARGTQMRTGTGEPAVWPDALVRWRTTASET